MVVMFVFSAEEQILLSDNASSLAVQVGSSDVSQNKSQRLTY